MAYAELAAAIYLGVVVHFLNTPNLRSALVLKAPIFPFAMALGAEALSRLNFI